MSHADTAQAYNVLLILHGLTHACHVTMPSLVTQLLQPNADALQFHVVVHTQDLDDDMREFIHVTLAPYVFGIEFFEQAMDNQYVQCGTDAYHCRLYYVLRREGDLRRRHHAFINMRLDARLTAPMPNLMAWFTAEEHSGGFAIVEGGHIPAGTTSPHTIRSGSRFHQFDHEVMTLGTSMYYQSFHGQLINLLWIRRLHVQVSELRLLTTNSDTLRPGLTPFPELPFMSSGDRYMVQRYSSTVPLSPSSCPMQKGGVWKHLNESEGHVRVMYRVWWHLMRIIRTIVLARGLDASETNRLAASRLGMWQAEEHGCVYAEIWPKPDDMPKSYMY